jgi:hypothetical protein
MICLPTLWNRLREPIIWIFIASLSFSLFHHYHGISFTSRSDTDAYFVKERIFLEGRNPYSEAATVAWLEQRLPELHSVLPVWNPPILFSSIGLIFSLPFSSRAIVVAVLSLISALTIYVTSVKLCNSSVQPRATYFFFSIFACPAFFIELICGQFSFAIIALFALGVLSFSRRRDFLAGFLLSLCVIKPHVAFLPLVMMGIHTLRQRRWQTIYGAIVSLAFFSICAEVVNPGIHEKWIHRESWPGGFFGSTWVSLVRAISLQYFSTPSNWILWALPLGGVLLLIAVETTVSRKYSSIEIVMLACLVNPLFSPYGYAFDQGLLMIPVTYITSIALDHLRTSNDLRHRFYFSVALLFAVWPVRMILNTVEVLGLPVVWFVYPIHVLLFFGILRPMLVTKVGSRHSEESSLLEGSTT